MSGMANGDVLRAMRVGYVEFNYILEHKDEFAGKPGDYHGNQAKRQRLAMMVRPHC